MTITTPGSDTTPTRLLSRGFATWLAAAMIADTGSGVLYFAVGWTAAGFGGHVAGLLLTLNVLPRTILLLFGGAAADRWGLRRTMIGCDVATCTVLLGYLAADRASAPTVYLLAGLALTTGVVTAFRMPASGAFPRLFYDDQLLPRALSLTGSMLQVASLIGPPLGGLVVAALAMSGAVTTRLASAAIILAALLLVRPRYEHTSSRQDGSTLTRIRQSLTAAGHAPGVVPLLGAVALVGGSLLPMLSLCVPLAAHERGWGPTATGLIEAGWITGSLSVSLLVARTGTSSRPIGPLACGPAIATIGVLAIAAAHHPAPAIASAFVMAIGTAGFTSHVLPLYMTATPHGMLARFQALLAVVQAAPILLANNLLGAMASSHGATTTVIIIAATTLLASAAVLTSRALRHSDHHGTLGNKHTHPGITP